MQECCTSPTADGPSLPRPPAASPAQSDALMGHPASERPFAAGKLFAKGEKMHFRALESPRGSFSDGTWKSQLQIRREILNTRYLLFCFRYFGKLSAYRILLLPEHINLLTVYICVVQELEKNRKCTNYFRPLLTFINLIKTFYLDKEACWTGEKVTRYTFAQIVNCTEII